MEKVIIMDKCPICLINDANKSNVHMIPWFLINKAVTHDGSGIREMALSFSLSPNRMTKVYAGQGILPEKLEELGNLSPLQIEKREPYSRDNLICTKCEDKLSRLEAIFAAEFPVKRLNAEVEHPKNKIQNHTIVTAKKYHHTLFELFIQSVFYRCSIGRYSGFKLKLDIEKNIAENLRAAFDFPDFKKLRPDQDIPLVHSFTVLMASFYIPPGSDTTRNVVTISFDRFPYFLTAGKWMLLLYEQEKHVKSSAQWLYGLSTVLHLKDAFEATKKTASIVMVEEQEGNRIYQNLLQYFAEKKVIGIKNDIKELHDRVFPFKPMPGILDFILRQYFVHLDKGETEETSLALAFMDLKRLH
jgi:hypothetical protein